jgi:hypothetical protein
MTSRKVTYGALVAGLLLFTAYRYMFYAPGHEPINNSLFLGLFLLGTYISLMFVRWRPFHIVALMVVCLAYAVQVAPATIGA